MKYEWDRGEQTAFALQASLSPAFFSDILLKRRAVGAKVARRLVRASVNWNEKRKAFPSTTVEQWLYPDEHDNPLLP